MTTANLNKKTFIHFFTFFTFCFLFLSSCSGITPISPPTVMPTNLPTVIANPLLISTATLSPLAISSENADKIMELARWGKGLMNTIAWSPSGETIAVAGALGIYIYDTKTLHEIRFIETPYPTSVSYSPDGKKVAAGGCSSQRGDVNECGYAWSSIYEVSSGNKLVSFETKGNNGGYLFFSPDGKKAASIACSDNRGIGVGCIQTKITVWDVASGKSVCDMVGHEGKAYTLTFSPDSLLLLTFDSGNFFSYLKPSAIFWDAKTCRQVKSVVGSSLSSYQTFIEQEKDPFFKTAWVDEVLLQTLKSVELRESFYGDESPNTTEIYPPTELTVVGFDERIEIWDLRSFSKITEFPVSTYIQSFSFSPDGQLLTGLTLDGIIIWDIKTGEILQQIDLKDNKYLIDSSGLLPDGRWVVTGSNQRDLVYIINPLTGKTIQTLEIKMARQVILHPNGKIIAVTKYSQIYGDKGFSLWNMETKSELFSTEEAVYQDALAFSPDGHYLAAGTHTSMLKLWDISNPQDPLPVELKGIETFREGINAIQFSADGKYLFAGDWEATIQIWHLPDAQPIQILRDSFASSFIASPNEKHIAYLDSHNITRLVFLDLLPLLNSEIRSTTAPYVVEDYYWKSALSFSPDSKVMIWGKNYNYGELGTIQLWDVENKQGLGNLEGHKLPVMFLSFSPDGQFIISSGYDGTIRLWGVKR